MVCAGRRGKGKHACTHLLTEALLQHSHLICLALPLLLLRLQQGLLPLLLLPAQLRQAPSYPTHIPTIFTLAHNLL